jgi:DNA helicase MCM8
MNSALLSRFDLIFILLDTANEEKDRFLAGHVMKVKS